MATIEGAFRIPAGLPVAEDVLGATLRTDIAGVPVVLQAPSAEWSGDSEKPRLAAPSFDLITPEAAQGLALEWGSPIAWSPTNRMVNSVSITGLRLRAVHDITVEEDRNRVWSALQEGFAAWWDAVALWVGSEFVHDMRNGAINNAGIIDKARGLHLWERSDPSWARHPSPPTVVITIEAFGAPVTRHQLEQILRKVQANEAPHLAWQLLYSASNGRRDGAKRVAVLDAATAVEVALAEFLRSELPKHGYPRRRIKALLRRKTLGPLLDLAVQSGFVDGDDVRNKLVRHRNKVAHEGKTITDDEARVAVKAGVNTVSRLIPRVINAPVGQQPSP